MRSINSLNPFPPYHAYLSNFTLDEEVSSPVRHDNPPHDVNLYPDWIFGRLSARTLLF